MAKARATKKYRSICAFEALAMGAHKAGKATGLRVTFHPKQTGPLPDKDNCIAAFKAGQDGLADALKINDRDLVVTHEISSIRGGFVTVEILFEEQA
jgi:hypothetical protein